MCPKVFIIILNWNGYIDTKECLKSLQAITYPNYQIVLVDNGSTDGSVEKLSNEFCNLKIIKAGRNLGFTGGNNLGISAAFECNADYVFLLNNDTTVAPNFLESLVTYCESNKKVGIICSKICYYDHPDTIWFAGSFFSNKLNDFPHRGSKERDHGQYNEIIEIDRAVGCAVLIPVRVLRVIGIFDDNFFLYYEDTDLSLRVRSDKYTIVYHPLSVVYHKIGKSEGAARSNYYYVRNKLYLYKKHRKLFPSFSILRLMSEYFKLVVLCLVSSALRLPSKNQALEGIMDFALNKMGRRQ